MYVYRSAVFCALVHRLDLRLDALLQGEELQVRIGENDTKPLERSVSPVIPDRSASNASVSVLFVNDAMSTASFANCVLISSSFGPVIPNDEIMAPRSVAN